MHMPQILFINLILFLLIWLLLFYTLGTNVLEHSRKQFIITHALFTQKLLINR